MKSLYRLRTAALGIGLLAAAWVAAPAHAAGLLRPAGGIQPPLALSEHHVQVTVEDGFATTQVDQVFANPHAEDLEAVYSFPVPEKAAVAEFTVWIDGKPVTAEVMEKAQARKVYEEEKQAGRDAGLAEQDGYKTFDIAVSPVRAGQNTRIRLVYLQPTQIDTGIGRYVYPLEDGGVDEARERFWSTDPAVRDRFSFELSLRSAYPVEALHVPGRAGTSIRQVGPGEWQARIDSQGQPPVAAENGAANPVPAQPAGSAYDLSKDLVVYWRQAAGLPGSVDVIAHKPRADGRGSFMMVVTPGDDLQRIEKGRDWVFVLDISGSMQGKYATLAEAVTRSLTRLDNGDRFRIVLFNSGARDLTGGFQPATPETVAHYVAALQSVQVEGSTNLYAGLQLALRGLSGERTGAIVLVTDGVANVGETAQSAFLKLIAQRDLRLFTFIMGNSANRPLLDSLAQASGGFAMSVSNADDIGGKLMLAASKVTHEALHGVKVSIDGVRTADLTPDAPGSLYRGDQLVVFGHYWGGGEASLRVEGRISGTPKTYATHFAFPLTAEDHPEIDRLWAYARILEAQEHIDNFGADADLRQAIVDLALEHGLVTNYTSMIVLREDVFQSRGIERRNRDRRGVEQAARQARVQQPVASHRVDQQQPISAAPRARLSGGGALDAWWLALLLPLLLLGRRRNTARA